MDIGRRIIFWTAAIITGVIIAAELAVSGLVGIALLVPALYVIPDTVDRIRIERSMRRELRSMLRD